MGIQHTTAIPARPCPVTLELWPHCPHTRAWSMRRIAVLCAAYDALREIMCWGSSGNLRQMVARYTRDQIAPERVGAACDHIETLAGLPGWFDLTDIPQADKIAMFQPAMAEVKRQIAECRRQFKEATQ